ncbi:MAG: hypothetical protein LBI94_10150 [Treponema sp.]|nr:hypothetical protein [Treponema sp.]
MIALLCLLAAAAPDSAAQEGNLTSESIPEALRRPLQGESPRYPRDLVIGSLARGDVSEGARLFAAQVLSALVAGNREAASLSRLGPLGRNELFSAVAAVGPRRYRIGEGREEADGSYSFLVRFLGRDQGVAGELYVRYEPAEAPGAGGTWFLDDLLLEEQRPLGDAKDDTYDLPPYERMF